MNWTYRCSWLTQYSSHTHKKIKIKTHLCLAQLNSSIHSRSCTKIIVRLPPWNYIRIFLHKGRDGLSEPAIKTPTSSTEEQKSVLFWFFFLFWIGNSATECQSSTQNRGDMAEQRVLPLPVKYIPFTSSHCPSITLYMVKTYLFF